MKNILKIIMLILILFFSEYYALGNVLSKTDIEKEIQNKDSIIIKAANITPSIRQFEWQKMEYNAFIHFGLYTFKNIQKSGLKNKGPEIFNPYKFDAKQWVKIIKDAGMKGLVLTCKHHEGFCLWPTKTTEFSIKTSPWKDGKGDIVEEVAIACKEEGIKFGIYLSPWDLHSNDYGSPKYNDIFVKQLTELLSNYGDIFEVWFDGFSNTKIKQNYDWERYYKVIRKLQPNAVISITGPDVRWVGNENGLGNATQWSVVPLKFNKYNDEKNTETQNKNFDPLAKSIGSRIDLIGASELIWYPAEVDVPIRPGWGYNPDEDFQVKSLEQLLDIYYSSVGMNSVLLLNFGPTDEGLIYRTDAQRAFELKKVLDATFENNIAKKSKVFCESTNQYLKGYECENVIDNNYDTYWTTPDSIHSAELIFNLNEPKTFNRVLIQENIRVGQRIENFTLEAWNLDQKRWDLFSEGTTIGYKRLLRFGTIMTNKVRLKIINSRLSPTISEFGLFYEPRCVDGLQ